MLAEQEGSIGELAFEIGPNPFSQDDDESDGEVDCCGANYGDEQDQDIGVYTEMKMMDADDSDDEDLYGPGGLADDQDVAVKGEERMSFAEKQFKYAMN